TRPELLRLLRTEDQVAEALLRTLGTIVRRTTRQVTDLVFLDLRGRVARERPDLGHPGGAGQHGQRGQADREPGAAVAGVRRLHPGQRAQLRDPRPGAAGGPGRPLGRFPGCQLADGAAAREALGWRHAPSRWGGQSRVHANGQVDLVPANAGPPALELLEDLRGRPAVVTGAARSEHT